MNAPRIGSLCTGYGGLDTAVQAVFGGSLAWVSDIDPGAAKIIARRMPGIPNLGDLTTTHWDQVEPVDIVCGGYPCQPFSNAGLRKGTQDERHIWPYIADALRVLRPRIAIFENVAGHLRLGFDTVLADLAGLGFDVEWACVRASEVGAPHQRNRLIVLATAADAADLGHERGGPSRGWGNGPADDSDAPADADRREPERGGITGVLGGQAAAEPGEGDQRERAGDTAGSRRPASANASGFGRGAGERHVQPGEPDAEGRTPADTDGSGRRSGPRLVCGQRAPERVQGDSPRNWGNYGPAITRWEHITGRTAPWAVDDRNRLNPLFVEWLMGLEAGHVTDVPGLTRTQQLHALGNGVVPQQAEAAIRLLVARATP